MRKIPILPSLFPSFLLLRILRKETPKPFPKTFLTGFHVLQFTPQVAARNLSLVSLLKTNPMWSGWDIWRERTFVQEGGGKEGPLAALVPSFLPVPVGSPDDDVRVCTHRALRCVGENAAQMKSAPPLSSLAPSPPLLVVVAPSP